MNLDQYEFERLKREAEGRLPKCEKCGKPFKPPFNFQSARLCFDCHTAKPFVKKDRGYWSQKNDATNPVYSASHSPSESVPA
jgi:hypothetical protein